MQQGEHHESSAEVHTTGRARRTSALSHEKLQAVKDLHLTQGGRLLQAVARNATEVGMHKVEGSNRHVKDPVKEEP